jgi:hypothetical protein
VTNVKMRSFIAPGQTVVLGAELAAANDIHGAVRLSAAIDGRTVATARLNIAGARELNGRETARGNHRRRARPPVGNDVATTWAALLAGKSGGVDQLVRRVGLSGANRLQVKGFDAAADRRPEASQVRESLAWFRARRRRAGVCGRVFVRTRRPRNAGAAPSAPA